MSVKSNASKVSPLIESFMKALVVASKAVALYPPSSAIPRETAKSAAELLGRVLQEEPELRITVAKGGMFFRDAPLLQEQATYNSFSTELYNRRLAEVRFHTGATAREIVAFLAVLTSEPEDIAAAGGFESRLWEMGVSAITVVDAHVSIVDEESLDLTEEAKRPWRTYTRAEVDEMLDDAYGGLSRDQITIGRFLDDTTAVTDYLARTFRDSADDQVDVFTTGARFAQLAEIAFQANGEGESRRLLASLGEVLQQLDPELSRSLLADEVLPEARTNEALASVVRQLDIDTVCKLLVANVDPATAPRSGIVRAIRNLSRISGADRSEVSAAAGLAMQGAGFSNTAVNEVLELAQPTKLKLRGGTPAPASGKPADAIFRLIDLAAGASTPVSLKDDPGFSALHEEARRGVTDGDVIMAMVTLVGLDFQDAHFASTMSVLEDSLDLIIERGDLDIAADIADALRATSSNPELSHEQRRRVERAVGRFCKPSDIRTIVHALRVYAPDSVEHSSARRLIAVMGSLSIEPLLEQLAEEEEMSARKMLVDLLAELAPTYVLEMGGHVADPRWYVVRNVVAILGSTRSPAVLPYVERTIRHPDARVRREAIRALSGIPDRLAVEMLIVPLSDEDSQNVRLAARYLGTSGRSIAVPTLEQVARGEGKGNRDTGPRVEAIEALGKLGEARSVPVLEAIAGRRTLIRGNKNRELKTAAESAIRRIASSEGGAA